MSNKRNIQEMLVSMGFPSDYVARAFRVYEKNYGHSYNIEVITEIIVRLQNKDRAKGLRSNQVKNKPPSAWDEELSFDILKTNQLVNCYNEWMSVKQAFGKKSSEALEWLNKQKTPFRKSLLSYVLICGYGKGIKIPLDVQNIIISFCNFMFIKLFYSSNDNKYEYRAFDTNISIRDLAKIFEIEHNLDTKNKRSIYSDYVHIFCRFGSIKHIYEINTDKINIYSHMLIGQNNLRWVEVPDDYMQHLYLKPLDDVIEYDKTLEIGLDFGIRVHKKNDITSLWSFNTNINVSKESTEFEWIFSLNIGDIIDVYNNDLKEWCCGVIRYISLNSFYIHYIGYDNKYDEEINSNEAAHKLKDRYHHCPFIVKRSMKRAKVNKIKFCWRTDCQQKK